MHGLDRAVDHSEIRLRLSCRTRLTHREAAEIFARKGACRLNQRVGKMSGVQ